MTGIKQTYATPLDEHSTTDKEGVGQLRFERNKVYKWVKFDNGAGNVAAVVGNLCYFFGNTGYQDSVVTSDQSDGRGPAGMFVSVPADAEYCWIQIKGHATVNQAIAGTAADGNDLSESATDGEFTRRDATNAAVVPALAAHGIDVSAKLVALDCPF